MLKEISIASNHICQLLLQQPNMRGLTSSQVSLLKTNLVEILTKKFNNHWHLQQPRQGEGYRAIFLSMQQQCDGVIRQACAMSGINFSGRLVGTNQLLMFINPGNVEITCANHTPITLYSDNSVDCFPHQIQKTTVDIRADSS